MVKSECDFGKVRVLILWGGAGGGGVEVSVIISIQCLNTWHSSAGYGVFHCGKKVIPLPNMGGIWRIPSLDRVFHCWIGVFHMGFVIIGSDIEYIKLEDAHSYLDEIFPKLNTP